MFERPEGGVVLILGSAPDAIRSRDWPREAFGTLVAINNAWRVREDWDYLIFPDDFPPDRRPAQLRSEQEQRFLQLEMMLAEALRKESADIQVSATH